MKRCSSPPGNSVFVDSLRSAAPPTIVGTKSANAAIDFCPATRVASLSFPSRSPPAPRASAAAAACRPTRRPTPSARVGVGRAPRLEARRPRRRAPRRRAPFWSNALVDAVGHEEVRVGIPAQRLLGQPHLVLAQRRAVGLGRPHLVRRRVADDRLDRGSATGGPRGAWASVDRAAERRQVVGVVDRADVPAVGLEALRDVLGLEAQRRRAVERDVVVVVEVDRAARARGARPARRPPTAMPSIRSPSDTIAYDVVVDDLGAVVRRAGSARRSPCRRRWRSPGPAARW